MESMADGACDYHGRVGGCWIGDRRDPASGLGREPAARHMDRPHLSIVIPTRDRAPILAATLEALARQRCLVGRGAAGCTPGIELEVIVADDGSTDETGKLLDALAARELPYKLRALSLPAAGPAAARNRGIAAARAPRVLLLGDDTLPEPDTVAAHLELGAGDELGVQGWIDWDPGLELTPVMRFLAPAGPQFYFAGLSDLEPVPYWSVLGSNLSAPTAWFRDEPFDEGFTHACFEDTELAWRWARRGRRVILARRARCLHRHLYREIEPFYQRQRRAGHAARRALLRHPAMAWQVAVLPAVVLLRRLPGAALDRVRGRLAPEQWWDLRCRVEMLRGLLLGG